MPKRMKNIDINVFFTDKELSEKAKELADLNKKIRSLESDKKSYDSSINAEIKEIQLLVDNLSDDVIIGHVEITVSAHVIKNYNTKKNEYWYNGEKIEEEDMNYEDMQTSFDEQEDYVEQLKQMAMVDNGELDSDDIEEAEVLQLTDGSETFEEIEQSA